MTAETSSNRLLISIMMGLVIITSLVSLMVIAGWHLDNKVMVAAILGYKPMCYNTALCLFFTSVGIFGRIFGRENLSVIPSTFSLCLSFIVFIQYVFNVNLHIDEFFVSASSLFPKNILYPGRMALNTSFSILLINVSTLLSVYFIHNRRLVMMMLFFSCSALGIAIVSVIGYVSGQILNLNWGKLSGMSIPASICISLLSIANCLLIRIAKPQISILPIGTIFIGASVSFLIAQGIHSNQNSIFLEKLNQDALEIRTAIQNSLYSNVNSLKQMAFRWQNTHDFGEKVWTVDSVYHVSSLVGMNCLQRLSLSFETRQNAANCQNVLSATSSNIDKIYQEASEYFKERITPFISKTIDTPTGVKYFSVILPIYKGGFKDGYLLATLDLNNFILESILNTDFRRYLIVIRENNQPILMINKSFLGKIPEKISGKSVIPKNVLNWEIELWPQSDDYNSFITSFPQRVFIIGLIVTFLLSYTLHLRHLAKTRSLQLESLNENLKKNEASLSDYSHRLKLHMDEVNKAHESLEEQTNALKKLAKALKKLAEEKDVALREAKESNLRALSASAAKTRFLAHINHEIRTPLNTIIGFSEMMKEECNGPLASPEYARYIDYIHESGKHLSEIIDDFLDLSKIEAGKMEAAPELIDIAQLSISIINLMVGLANEKNITMLKNLPSEQTLLYADPRHTKQMLLNLLSNAIKYTPNDGTITLEVVKTPENNIKIIIQDTGIGIDHKYLEKIFEPFEAFNQSDGDVKLQGTGLGLAIVKSLAEINKGSIAIESELGIGTNVSLTFPSPPEDAKTKTSSLELKETEKKIIHLPPLKILAAEDNRTNQMFLQALLENGGHYVDFVGTGVEAIEAVQKKYYDLILMDMQMPEMHGDEATRRIRSLPSAVSKIPIIALTANTLPEDKERILASGMNGYLAKPVRLETLLLEIKRCLNV